MPRPDLLANLPSLEDLLEHPRVAATVQRVNQSTAAAQVRRAVTSLAAEVSRRAEEWQGVAPSEWVERVVRGIDQPVVSPAQSPVNATGVLFGEGWLGPAWPAVAIDAAHAAASGQQSREALACAQAAQSLWGAESAHAFATPSGAFAAVLGSLAGAGVCIVPRSQMHELAPNVRLDEIAARHEVALREVGATDRLTYDDVLTAVHTAKSADRPTVVLLRDLDETAERVIADSAPHATVLLDASNARPRDDTPAHGANPWSIERGLATNAHAVLCDASRWIGGPSAGLIVGSRDIVDQVRATRIAHALSIDPVVDAALACTLQLFEKPDSLRFAHPLYALLDTPIENLRTRAESLATRVSAALPGVHASVAERESAFAARATCVLVLKPAEGDAASLADRLASATAPVHASVAGQSVELDLLSVPPAQDRWIVDPFENRGEPPAE